MKHTITLHIHICSTLTNFKMMKKIKLTNLAQEKLSDTNMGSLLGGGEAACYSTKCKIYDAASTVSESLDSMIENNPRPTQASEISGF